ncbi:MFS transporter [Pseudahrensia aquimaris]|uniref:MFS transporter n=1 Tax=Pseudahrensia aquimaris TaxID=744461 RepID=A0ABW3FED7_9HYPH
MILLLWCAGLGAAAQFAKIAVPFPALRMVYPDAGAELGWLLSLLSLVGAVLGIVAGELVGRLGAKRLVLVGMGVGAAASFYQSLLPSFEWMLLSRVVEGAAHLAIVVGAPTLIGQIAIVRFLGAAMTLWSTFFGVAFALVAWVGLPLVETYGLTGLFLAHGTVLVVAGILIALVVPSVEPVAHCPTTNGWFKRHAQAYSSPFVAAAGAGWFFYTLTFVALLAVVPDLLPADQAGPTLSRMSLVSIGVSLAIVPLLIRRASSVSVVVAGLALAIAVVILGFGGENLALWAVVLFAVLGLVQGASFSAVPELNSAVQDQALAFGLMAQTGNIGNLLGTPILLLVLALGDGNRAALIVALAVIYALAILVHALLALRRRAIGRAAAQ